MRRLLVLLFTVAGAFAATDRQPHVLLICVDDLKPALGCYGDALARTPNIDRLAARGMRFDAAYCNQAVCSPSRNNLMLGSRSTSLGIYNLGTNFRAAVPAAVTLTQYFMRHGWRAEGMGKILHVGHGNTNDTASWSVPFHPEKLVEYVLPASTGGKLTREEAFFSNAQAGPNTALPRGAAWEAPDVPDTAYGDGRLAELAVQRLRDASKDPSQRLFLAVGFARPHLPFCVPKKYWDMHDPAKLPLAKHTEPPQNAPAYAGKTTLELNQYEPIPARGPVPDDLQRKLVHGYYASVSYVDAQLGKVIDEVDRLGLADETVIVLWGDHGWHLGDHGMWTKHTNYEQAVRIPLLVVAPGVTRANSQSKALIETVDIFPTLCELAKLPSPSGLVPQPMDGRSLVPILKDPKAGVRDHAYHAYPRNRGAEGQWLGRGVRTEKHRLVEWKKFGAAADTADIELYDYAADPAETKNIAASQPEVVAKLKAMLATHPEPKAPLRR
jgi:iduronate 2-sulfatase